MSKNIIHILYDDDAFGIIDMVNEALAKQGIPYEFVSIEGDFDGYEEFELIKSYYEEGLNNEQK